MAVFSAASYLGTGGTEPRLQPRFATEPHANSRAGYSFAYPPGWRLRERGSVATVMAPRRDVSVSFGLGGKGDLRRAAIRFVGELEETYRKVVLTGFQLTLLDGEPAVSFTGTAVNRRSEPIRFQAVSVAGPRRNYAVAVFVAADADPTEVVPRVQEVMDSFRLTG